MMNLDGVEKPAMVVSSKHETTLQPGNTRERQTIANQKKGKSKKERKENHLHSNTGARLLPSAFPCCNPSGTLHCRSVDVSKVIHPLYKGPAALLLTDWRVPCTETLWRMDSPPFISRLQHRLSVLPLRLCAKPNILFFFSSLIAPQKGSQLNYTNVLTTMPRWRDFPHLSTF